MQACGVDLGDLSDVVRQYLDQELPVAQGRQRQRLILSPPPVSSA
jgi:hypothetical protein